MRVSLFRREIVAEHGQVLIRAVKTIEAEVAEWAHDRQLEFDGVDAIRELLHRLGRRDSIADPSYGDSI